MQALFHRKANSKKNTKNMEKMKAADLIMLELGVQWPISIVLTPHNMRAFQFCFRHLVNVKVGGPRLPCPTRCMALTL
ncbi:MAG: hypothetical protein HC767_01510 [Akkermansiaceae bacterium]|nr:hypothetical protein [Akkermansiaceae bacterium]